MDLEPITSRDLVALGSFFGGTTNTSGGQACAGMGGLNNVGGSDYCHAPPGQGYGWFDGGWTGRPC